MLLQSYTPIMKCSLRAVMNLDSVIQSHAYTSVYDISSKLGLRKFIDCECIYLHIMVRICVNVLHVVRHILMGCVFRGKLRRNTARYERDLDLNGTAYYNPSAAEANAAVVVSTTQSRQAIHVNTCSTPSFQQTSPLPYL